MQQKENTIKTFTLEPPVLDVAIPEGMTTEYYIYVMSQLSGRMYYYSEQVMYSHKTIPLTFYEMSTLKEDVIYFQIKEMSRKLINPDGAIDRGKYISLSEIIKSFLGESVMLYIKILANATPIEKLICDNFKE
ncbi:hypothetical protein YM80_004814 [Salmonella enterica subsp. salamae]|nr:hypothetical protein [Salmonella enterica subsp. salamae]